MTALTARLQSLSQRLARARAAFDARSVRERLLLGAAALAATFMLADHLWLTPAFKSWQVARHELRQAQSQLAIGQQEAARVQAMAAADLQQARQDLAQWRQRVREGDLALRSREAALVGPDRMLPLLEQLLAGHGRVRVRAMQSLPKADLLEAAGAPANGAPVPSLYRHGVELTLEGNFADLLAYLRALEAMPQRVLWGGMQFKVEQHPKAVLTLRLHTLSLDRHWLEI